MKRKVLGGRSAKPQGGASRLDPVALIGRERGAVAAVVFILQVVWYGISTGLVLDLLF